MKKLIYNLLTVLLFFVSFNISAQPSEYYHVGDTIVGRSPIYFYQWWSESWLADTSHRLSAHRDNPYCVFLHGEILQYYYTEMPLQIIGIATSCLTQPGPGVSDVEWPGNTLHPEYLRLYEASEETFELVKEVQYDKYSPRRYMRIDTREFAWDIDIFLNGICCYWESTVPSKTVDISEYYFDKPVTVSDSFYLGYTMENSYLSSYDIYRDTIDSKKVVITPWALFWNESTVPQPHDFTCDHTCDNTPDQLHKYRNIVWDMQTDSPTYGDTIDSLSVWRWSADPYYFVQFPIVVIDSSYIIPPYECPPVTNLRIAHQDEGRAVLYWDTHADQNSWQVCFGPQGTPPDSCTLFNCPIQVGDIRGLDSCTHYDAYVRAVCHHDSTCYSRWVGPLDIFICDTTSGGGEGGGDSLSTVTALNVLTNIVPNPASTQATVYSSFQINHITAYSSNGQMVLDRPVSGLSTTLDIRGWAPGLYIVVIHTPAGNVAKKLVVK